jgi:hypothetical protein
MTSSEIYVSLEQIAEHCGLSARHIQRHAKNGWLKVAAQRPGIHGYRLTLNNANSWIALHRPKAGPITSPSKAWSKRLAQLAGVRALPSVTLLQRAVCRPLPPVRAASSRGPTHRSILDIVAGDLPPCIRRLRSCLSVPLERFSRGDSHAPHARDRMSASKEPVTHHWPMVRPSPCRLPTVPQ